MIFLDKTILVTGANRGIGKAIVDEALNRGVKHVYAGSRQVFAHSDSRVTVLNLDITDADQIRKAVERVESLDLLINNAGVALWDDASDRALIEQHLNVNLFGTHAMIYAFLPQLVRPGGAIVNVLSTAGLGALPMISGYSISKAAAFSFSQSLRAILAGQGVKVHVVLPGPVDTDMSRGFDVPKAAPEAVAQGIFDGIALGEEEIFPDPASAGLADSWRNGALKAMERQNAGFLQPAPSS